jgi:EAL domain-containing protein (putative c-di-GMP-specific phosphodiesterase class I)
LELWNVDPAFLTLELTEGAMIDDPRQAFAMLTALKELGVRISIDDFGTGYSSLQYLSNLPIDELKIDQSFLRDSSAWESNQKIVKTIVNLAKNFNLEVVAEGVETREILEFLRRIGCHTAQGYFISKPLTEGDFLEFIGKGPAPLSNGLFDNA